MKFIAALPVLIAFLVGALPAHAWTWPVAGPVLHPFQLGDDPYAPGQHRGIDVGAPPGTAVVAPASGVVSFAGTVPRGGRTITIATPDGYAVTLVHLGSVAVTRNAAVDEGVTVGTIGPSGDAEHAQGYVHLGIRVASEPHGYVDPETLLPPAPAGGDGEVPEPAEAPEQEAEAPAEPGGVEPEPPSPDPGGGAELPAEQAPEQIPEEPPAEGAPQPAPGESTPVPVELPAETGYQQPNPDRVTEELSAVPVPSAKAYAGSPATHADTHLPAESVGGGAHWARGFTPARGPGGPTRPEPASQEAQGAGAGRRVAADQPPVEPAGPAGRPTTGDQPVGVLGAGMFAVAALVAAVLALVLVRIGVRVRSTPTGDGDPSMVAADAEVAARTVREDASADLDVWLAELLSPRAPCPSRVVRAGRRAGACRHRSAGRTVTRSRVARGPGERSARAGRVRLESRSRS